MKKYYRMVDLLLNADSGAGLGNSKYVGGRVGVQLYWARRRWYFLQARYKESALSAVSSVRTGGAASVSWLVLAGKAVVKLNATNQHPPTFCSIFCPAFYAGSAAAKAGGGKYW